LSIYKKNYSKSRLCNSTEVIMIWDTQVSKSGVSFFVFSMTYADYSQLAKTPAAGELMDKILDADPLVEMHHCGNRQAFTSIVDELNALILAGKLDRCRRLK
jgi:hypothetical protein